MTAKQRKEDHTVRNELIAVCCLLLVVIGLFVYMIAFYRSPTQWCTLQVGSAAGTDGISFTDINNDCKATQRWCLNQESRCTFEWTDDNSGLCRCRLRS